MTKLHIGALLFAILLSGCDQVTPVAPNSTGEFEGLTVHSYVPAIPSQRSRHITVGQRLLPYRFTRIPAIDTDEAEIITEALRNTGAWDAQGNRILDIVSTLSLVDPLVLPPNFGATPAQVLNQVKAMMAVHQFVGLYRVPLVDFFDTQLAP